MSYLSFTCHVMSCHVTSCYTVEGLKSQQLSKLHDFILPFDILPFEVSYPVLLPPSSLPLSLLPLSSPLITSHPPPPLSSPLSSSLPYRPYPPFPPPLPSTITTTQHSTLSTPIYLILLPLNLSMTFYSMPCYSTIFSLFLISSLVLHNKQCFIPYHVTYHTILFHFLSYVTSPLFCYTMFFFS